MGGAVRVVRGAGHPGGGGGVTHGVAGGVEVAVTVVCARVWPGVVAVVPAPPVLHTLSPALRQAVHLPDEVDGEVLTLTVDRLTPGTSADNRSGGGQTRQQRQE